MKRENSGSQYIQKLSKHQNVVAALSVGGWRETAGRRGE
jgi:hypothetical protein